MGTAGIRRRGLLAANWKMNPVTVRAATALVQGLLPAATRHADQVEIAVCPPFPWLLPVSELVEGSPLGLGAQDCFWEESGPYTGEVSAQMLSGWCQWVITGHSERRQHQGETDADVARKAAAALGANVQAIVCVGEGETDFDAGRTEAIVSGQVRNSLAQCEADDSSRLAVAYEPIWAIGTGRNAEPEHAYRTLALIRSLVADLIGEGASRQVRLLYGGSVTAANVESYVELPNCDGCLVGGASLRVDEFTRLIEATAQVYAIK